jgi:predicted nucleic acid-binding protein
VTVLDTSVVIDFLLGDGVATDVEGLLVREGAAAAPDLLVFEVLAVLRRDVSRHVLEPVRAQGAIDDLGDLPVELFGSLPLRGRAWELRENLTAADALFVALAEHLAEPLATKDRGLASAARDHGRIETLVLAQEG